MRTLHFTCVQKCKMQSIVASFQALPCMLCIIIFAPIIMLLFNLSPPQRQQQQQNILVSSQRVHFFLFPTMLVCLSLSLALLIFCSSLCCWLLPPESEREKGATRSTSMGCSKGLRGSHNSFNTYTHTRCFVQREREEREDYSRAQRAPRRRSTIAKLYAHTRFFQHTTNIFSLPTEALDDRPRCAAAID